MLLLSTSEVCQISTRILTTEIDNPLLGCTDFMPNLCYTGQFSGTPFNFWHSWSTPCFMLSRCNYVLKYWYSLCFESLVFCLLLQPSLHLLLLIQPERNLQFESNMVPAVIPALMPLTDSEICPMEDQAETRKLQPGDFLQDSCLVVKIRFLHSARSAWKIGAYIILILKHFATNNSVLAHLLWWFLYCILFSYFQILWIIMV